MSVRPSGRMDRKQRLAAQVAAERGWEPLDRCPVGSSLRTGRTNERAPRPVPLDAPCRVSRDARRIRVWLRDPVGSIAALSISARGRSPVGAGAVRRSSDRSDG